MRMTRSVLVLAACIAGLGTPVLAQAPSFEPVRAIANVKGDLFRANEPDKPSDFVARLPGGSRRQ